MEISISPFTFVSPVLSSPINLRRSLPSRVSIGRLRSSHDIHLIKPWIRERRRKEWWRWAEFPDPHNPLSDPDPISDEDSDPIHDEDSDRISDEDSDRIYDEDSDPIRELEEMEEEAMDGRDEGREPSDYDRRAQIFGESSRVFRALKEKKSENGGNEGGEKGE